MARPDLARASSAAPTEEGTDWYALSVDDTCRRLDVDTPVGLSATEVATRRQRYGPNKLAEEAKEPAWQAWLRQYRDLMQLVLHVSKGEQKRRFMARLDQPNKQWKFNAADVAERARWDHYMQAYEDAITATSTDWAPWYVLPADHKRVMQAMAAAIIVDTIGSLDLRWPTVSDEARDANANARLELEAEAD